MRIVISNAEEFIRKAEAALARIERWASAVYRGFAIDAFNQIVEETPQWSGSAAASWNFSVGSDDTSADTLMAEDYKSLTSGTGWWEAGNLYNLHDSPAIARAKERNGGRERAVDLDSVIFVSNHSRGVSDSRYASLLETNPGGFLRPENEGGGMIAKVKARISQRYRPIRREQQARLAGLRIGGGR